MQSSPSKFEPTCDVGQQVALADSEEAEVKEVEVKDNVPLCCWQWANLIIINSVVSSTLLYRRCHQLIHSYAVVFIGSYASPFPSFTRSEHLTFKAPNKTPRSKHVPGTSSAVTHHRARAASEKLLSCVNISIAQREAVAHCVGC